jgi:hypothetical protein
LEYCQLFLPRGTGEPLPVETKIGEIGFEGAFLPIVVHPYQPPYGSFELAVVEIAKALGPSFVLHRQDRVLEMPPRSPSSSSRRPRRPHPMTVGDKVVLPGDFYEERQFYHIFYTKQHELVTFYESLQTILERLLRENSPEIIEAKPQSLLMELEGLQQQVRQWFWTSVGSQFCRPRPQRQCSMSNFWEHLSFPDVRFSLQQQALASSGMRTAATSATDDGRILVSAGSDYLPEFKDDDARTDYGGFFCPLKGKGKLLKSSCEDGSDTDESQEGVDIDTIDSAKDEWRLSHQVLAPTLGTTTTAAVAACSTPSMLGKPIVHWVMREVADRSASSVVLAPSALSKLAEGAVSASGAVTGAALASRMGPLAAMMGGIGGAVTSHAAEKWIATRSLTHNMAMDHGYGLTRSVADGKMYLAHKEAVAWPSMNGFISTTLLTATVQAGCNIVAYANGEMTARDVALVFLKDVRDGVAVWLTVKGFVTAMTVGELRASGLLASACSLALHYPVPATFGMLGCGYITLRCVAHSMRGTAKSQFNQFQSNLVLMGASNAVGIAVSLGAGALGAPPITAAIATCGASYAAGIWAHEAWRAIEQRRAEDRLRDLARSLLGLPHEFNSQMLQRRWRTLARLSHPDRNRQPEARKTFTLFQLCRDVLEEALHHPERDAGRLRGLLRYARRTCWLDHHNLPPVSLLPKYEQARPRDPLPIDIDAANEVIDV